MNGRQVERGRYLVSVLGCNDCHTPWVMTERGPEPDMTRMLSGHPREMAVTPAALPEPWVWAGTDTNTAYNGPWGVSFAANLTPDENTGLGIWTEDQFIQTLRSGRHWGIARPILPPMPWHAYRNLTDRDIKAVYAYLRSIPAIYNEVPEAIIYEPLDDVAVAEGATQ